MDHSSVIATLVPGIGIVLSIRHGIRAATSGRTSYWGKALLHAIALGSALTFTQVVLHGLCIDALHLCAYGGDANMSYWFQSFFAIPIFWLVAGVVWQLKKDRK